MQTLGFEDAFCEFPAQRTSSLYYRGLHKLEYLLGFGLSVPGF